MKQLGKFTSALAAVTLMVFWLTFKSANTNVKVLYFRKGSNTISYNICSLSGEGVKLDSLPLIQRVLKRKSTKKRCREPFSWSQYQSSLLHDRELPGVCDKSFDGEPFTEIEERWIDTINRLLAQDMKTSKALSETKNCSWVRNHFSNGYYTTQKEAEFPIAYVLTIDQSPHQVLEFLRAIYRPHNVYCLHIDSKSSHSFKQVFFNVAACLDNVIIPRKLESVYWGWHTFLDAQMRCFSELFLVRVEYPWKYVITLCGKEVPLRTNAETVAILELLNGTSSVRIVGDYGADDYKFKWKWSLNKMTGWMTMRDEPLPPIPYGLKVYKSSAYMALSYHYVEHILCSTVAIALREYMKDVKIPEENFYAMLYMQPETPGGFRPELKDYIFSVISCIWMNHGKRLKLLRSPTKLCAGTVRHDICIVNARDLHKLAYRPGIAGYRNVDSFLRSERAIQSYSGHDRGPLFHNKYSMESDHVIINCMGMELIRRNRLEHERECR